MTEVRSQIAGERLWISERGLDGSGSNDSFIDHRSVQGFDNRYPIVVALQQCEVEIDVDDLDCVTGTFGNWLEDCQSFVAQRTSVTCVEAQHRAGAGHRGSLTIVSDMRPVTSIAVVVLLAFIVIAFIVKLLTGGLSP